MAKFSVKTVVEFYGEVEAESAEEAEQMGWDWDSEPFMYDGVFDIMVEEMDEEEDDSEDE